jgi:hypothetical protein
MYGTEEDVEFLYKFCVQIKAAAPPEFWTAPFSDLKRAYNGIGPEHWPGWARKALSVLLRPFAAAALVHDFEFSREYKSRGMFNDANLRLAINIAKTAVYNRRPVLIVYGIAAGLLCEFFGYKAYKEGRLKDDDAV